MDAFIARQPIFDSRQRVFGYELLFRSSLENVFRSSNPDQATSKVISDAFFLFNFSTLTEGKRAFINLTREILLKEYIFLIPKDLVVVEILENVEPDAEVIEVCRRMKQAGYLLAMDDFVYKENLTPLLEMADFVKVDFLSASESERRALVREFAPRGIRLLAEKVETPKDFSEALELGYKYFQGYFFCKPLVIKGKDIPGSKLHYFQVLQEIHHRQMDFRRLEQIIKQDVSLSYKLLRYINSAYFGLRNKIYSIKQALLLLGQAEIKKWLSLITLAGMGTDKPGELVVHTITRAKFCESLAPHAGLFRRADDLFLVGMLSLMDAFLDRPLSDLLIEVPINDEIKGAILEKQNRLGEVYDYVLSYEKGDWARLNEQQMKLGIHEVYPPQLYLNALKWGQEAFHS
ncbi:MAG: HDOD domain-containing protein [Syntrophaceae bacterium]|nr:HDOD domain-containing protein [Syntrophaceae bacterium]